MHPNTLILSLVALASVAVSTKDKDHGPRCPEDEYYNKMMESKNRNAAVTDCAKWLSGTITDAKEIPKYLKDCAGDKDEERVSRVSAACSCISTSSVPTTLSTRTPSPVSSTPSSTAVVTTTSISSSHQLSSPVSSTGSTSQSQSTTPLSSLHTSTLSPSPSSNHPPSSPSSSTCLSSTTTSSVQHPPTSSVQHPTTSPRPSSHQPSTPSSSMGSTSSTGRSQSPSSSDQHSSTPVSSIAHSSTALSSPSSHQPSSPSSSEDSTSSSTGSHTTPSSSQPATTFSTHEVPSTSSYRTTSSSATQNSGSSTTSQSYTSSSQSAHPSSSQSTFTPVSPTGHNSSSSTVPHPTASNSQPTLSSSTGRHSTPGSLTTDHTQTSESQTTGSQTTKTLTTSSPLSPGSTTGTSTKNTQTVPPTTQPTSGSVNGPSHTQSSPTPSQSSQSTVTVPESSITTVAPLQASTTSFTTSTIYTESVYTVTSCAPGKPDCRAASTVVVTSTIAVSTTVCPVTETPRPGPPIDQPTTRRTTSTIYSTSTYTLTRCPPGAVSCRASNLPIITIIPISSTIVSVTDAVPTPEHSDQAGSRTDKEILPTQTSTVINNPSAPEGEKQGGKDEGNGDKEEGAPTHTGDSNGDNGKPGQSRTIFTVITVPTTIHTTMNGVTAQILTVVPVTSALVVSNDADSTPTPLSTADAGGVAAPQPAAIDEDVGDGPLAPPQQTPSHPQASPKDTSFDATAWQPTGASKSGLTSSSPRQTVVTAGAPGLAGTGGLRVAFCIFVLVAFVWDLFCFLA